ncbi:Thioredoxin, mitochondrial [Lamellibrachia satsuma]|nr:Thioredoxin, mitochondrial [Lamellibrachia satsuma]
MQQRVTFMRICRKPRITMAQKQLLRAVIMTRSTLTSMTTRVLSQSIRPVCSSQLRLRLPLAAPIHTTAVRWSDNIFNVQDLADFNKRVISGSGLIIVDFHAEWCAPCKMLGPRLESVIGGMAGKVSLAKVDVDNNSEVAIDFGVQAVPTVLAVKDGKVVDKFIGLKEEADLTSFINNLLPP